MGKLTPLFKEVDYRFINGSIDVIKERVGFVDSTMGNSVSVYNNFIPRYAICPYIDIATKEQELINSEIIISAMLHNFDEYIPDPTELQTTIAFMDMYLLEKPVKFLPMSQHGFMRSRELLTDEFAPAVVDYLVKGADEKVVKNAIAACGRAALVDRVTGDARIDKLGFYAYLTKVLTFLVTKMNDASSEYEYTGHVIREIRYIKEISGCNFTNAKRYFFRTWSMILNNAILDKYARLLGYDTCVNFARGRFKLIKEICTDETY